MRVLRGVLLLLNGSAILFLGYVMLFESQELWLNLGDGLAGQAAAVMG
ncbi:hypothetical protein ACF1BQ_030520 [Bradyrhizobium sp. RDT10]